MYFTEKYYFTIVLKAIAPSNKITFALILEIISSLSTIVKCS